MHMQYAYKKDKYDKYIIKHLDICNKHFRASKIVFSAQYIMMIIPFWIIITDITMS